MGYCYAHRVCADPASIITELREVVTTLAGNDLLIHSWYLQELYVQDYNSINWAAQRDNVAQGDIYHPHHWILNVLFGMLLLEDMLLLC